GLQHGERQVEEELVVRLSFWIEATGETTEKRCQQSAAWAIHDHRPEVDDKTKRHRAVALGGRAANDLDFSTACDHCKEQQEDQTNAGVGGGLAAEIGCPYQSCYTQKKNDPVVDPCFS